MNLQLTSKQKSVIVALSNQHLTSSEILSKAQKVPHILKLYSILDELRRKGVIQSYMKDGVKYHCVA
ncbi:hypothetical protein [Pseudotenacibaculum haliotis]|uniref:Transcriptional regulator n=1 Tax=Pseudotenacibaculum haliotis TaxID=1862138 RepID=A0ABW5LWV7_9FLAO